MNAVFLCGRGANYQALANKLHAVSPLAAVVTIEAPPLSSSLGQVISALLGLPLRRAWVNMQDFYRRRCPRPPSTRVMHETDVNSENVVTLIEEIKPSVVMVSGTNLLKKPLIEAISRSGIIMNLHTGISPYVRGGPNCTNWCLALGEFELIGNTVMWLDIGIDSGNLIATERTHLTGKETLAALHLAVMEHAHDLFVRCFVRLRDGLPLPSVPQDQIGRGRLFLSKDWNGVQAARAVWNYRLYFRNSSSKAPPQLEFARTLDLAPLD